MYLSGSMPGHSSARFQKGLVDRDFLAYRGGDDCRLDGLRSRGRRTGRGLGGPDFGTPIAAVVRELEASSGPRDVRGAAEGTWKQWHRSSPLSDGQALMNRPVVDPRSRLDEFRQPRGGAGVEVREHRHDDDEGTDEGEAERRPLERCVSHAGSMTNNGAMRNRVCFRGFRGKVNPSARLFSRVRAE